MKIKVCGLTCLPQLYYLDALNINFLGFIFYEPSPRYVLKYNSLKNLQNLNLKHAQTVGVFVDENIDILINIANKIGLNCIQLHGNENPDYCMVLKSKGFQIIKVFKIDLQGNLNNDYFKDFEPWCDYFMFDTLTPKQGGAGQSFPWHTIQNLHFNRPYFLSGGIQLSNIQDIKFLPHQPFSIDINSKFEWTPGFKNTSKIIQALEILRQ
ncbi:MAG: phosphoribosylanthranilate isomerase [Alphaproteobacteria bacterium]|nr:phosphoribosylanthranilate isomerase [Alphaproteobacteria bacterium]